MIRNVIKISSAANVIIKRNISNDIISGKVKGTTLFDKWTAYWKNLILDYRQMLQDLRSDVQEEPRKAFYWSLGLISAYTLYQKNPDDIDFKDKLKNLANEISLVSEDCRNTEAIEHIRYIETCYNEGVIHYQSLGLLSLMYVSELNDDCDLFKTHCSYLKPSYFSLLSKVVDIGCMGQWWNIYIKTNNYDINF